VREDESMMTVKMAKTMNCHVIESDSEGDCVYISDETSEDQWRVRYLYKVQHTENSDE